MSENKPFLGRGWAFPPSFSLGGTDVDMVAGVEDVHQSVQIILHTMPGERVMQDQFGCDLTGFTFAEIDRSLVNRVQRLVQKALLDHEPRIIVDSVKVTRDTTDPSCLIINTSYTIRGTNTRYNMVYPFYVMEATLRGS